MKKLLFFTSIILLFSCTSKVEKEFSEVALKNNLLEISGTLTSLEDVLNLHKGKKVLIDVWASWCADCVRGFPKVKELQQEFPEVAFLFLSVDKNINAWKKGISRFKLTGEHYLVENDFDSDLSDFLDLSWIPRYLVIDEKGKISLFKATKAADEKIVKALNKS